jgi:hypothetical protein
MADECWHEFNSNGTHSPTCPCGTNIWSDVKYTNPHYTIQTIVALKDLRLWESFVWWADITLARALSPLADCLGETNITYSDTRVMLADILTTDSLLIDAAISFLQEVLDNG